MPYNVNNRSITIFKLSVSFVYLLLLICYSFGVAVTGLDLILFSELFNLIVFPFNELSRSIRNNFILLYSVFLAGIHLDTVLTMYVLCSIVLEQTLSGEKRQEHKVFLPCFFTNMLFRQLSVFFCPFSTTVSLHG